MSVRFQSMLFAERKKKMRKILKFKKKFSLCRGQGTLYKTVECEDRAVGYDFIF